MDENCDKCGGEMYRDRTCGVMVCEDCNDHRGLARCFCGFSRSGNDGREELAEMGECLDYDY